MHNKNLEALGWILVKLRLPTSGLIQVLITNGKYVCVSKARILVAHPDVATHWMPLSRNTKTNQTCHRQEKETTSVTGLLSEYTLHCPESKKVPG